DPLLPYDLRPPLSSPPCSLLPFFFNHTPPTEIYTLSLHDALPISSCRPARARRRTTGSPTPAARSASPCRWRSAPRSPVPAARRSEEHTSELQSLTNLVCRLLLEKKKKHIILAHGETYRTTMPAIT